MKERGHRGKRQRGGDREREGGMWNTVGRGGGRERDRSVLKRGRHREREIRREGDTEIRGLERGGRSMRNVVIGRNSVWDRAR